MWVKIIPNNSTTPPEIQPNYLDNDFDQEILVDGIKLVRKIFSSSPLNNYFDEETLPGKMIKSDYQILEYASGRMDQLFTIQLELLEWVMIKIQLLTQNLD